MYYKHLQSPSLSRSMQSVFSGLNKNVRIADSEFSDMTNMSGDSYPLLTPRAPRVLAQKQLVLTEEIVNDDGTTEISETPRTLNGILGDVGFCAVWDNEFYYMGEKIEGISLDNSEKKLVAMGANILIYPDAVYYNTVTGEHGNIAENEKVNIRQYLSCYNRFDIDANTSLTCNIHYQFSHTTDIKTQVRFLSPNVRDNAWVVDGCPEAVSLHCDAYTAYDSACAVIGKKDGYVYYCTEATVTTTKYNGFDIYHFAKCKWKKLNISYFKLTAAEFNNIGFTDEDIDNIWCGKVKVKIEKKTDGNYYVTNENIADAINMRTIKYAGDTGLTGRHKYNRIGSGLRTAGTWRVRTVPMLDYVCVHENRLWGCRYGVQVNSEDENKTVNEIYCSALGDFKRWVSPGETTTLAGDPYAMSVGEYGPFTGCVSLRGQLLFFKNNIVYRVSGNKPSNFQIDKISENGLQEGCEKTLEIIDNVLFYKSRNGVFAYDGSIPQKISDALGNFYYTDAVAGKYFSKYYITMVHDGKRCLYVYDKSTGLWHAEDDADIRFFTEYEGALYGAVGNDIVCLSGIPAEIFNATKSEGKVEWSVETGDIGLDSPYLKYYHRLLVRMDIDTGARVKVSLLCGDEWMHAADFTSAKKQSVILPIVTPRCEHMRIKFDGCGAAKIYSIYYETESVEGKP